MSRKLADNEVKIIKMIAEKCDEDTKRKLLNDLSFCSVIEEMTNGEILRFHLDKYERGEFKGQNTYGIDIVANDVDGSPITILLFYDKNKRLYEMEFIKWCDPKNHGKLAVNWTSLSYDGN